jgi:hypothetical protein
MRKILNLSAIFILILGISQISKADLILESFKVEDSSNKVKYSANENNQQQTFFKLLKELEDSDKFTELYYREGSTEANVFVLSNYLIKKEDLNEVKNLIKKVGLDESKLELKDQELSVKYLVGRYISIEIKEKDNLEI